MIDISEVRADGVVLDRNQRRQEGEHGRCLLCYSPIRNPENAKMVYVHDGGDSIVTEEEREEMNRESPGADLGGQMIGPECYRKNREILKPYLWGGGWQ